MGLYGGGYPGSKRQRKGSRNGFDVLVDWGDCMGRDSCCTGVATIRNRGWVRLRGQLVQLVIPGDEDAWQETKLGWATWNILYHVV